MGADEDGLRLVPGAPDFAWCGRPREHDWDGTRLLIDAGPGTDWFTDPGGQPPTASAPLLLAPATAPTGLQARVRTQAPRTFDAGALFVFCDPQSWAKFAIERSPQGVLTVVTVITRGTSDDANHQPVHQHQPLETEGLHLRVSVLDGGCYAFHVSADARAWSLVRYFRLDGAPRVGFSAQSPTGPGCGAVFDRIAWSPAVPADLRDGS